MFAKNKKLVIVIGTVSLMLIIGVFTVLNEAPRDSNIFYLILIQLLGPIGGWVDSIIQGMFFQALWMILLATGLTFVSVVFSITKKSLVGLIVSCLLWWFSGYMFAIGIWI